MNTKFAKSLAVGAAAMMLLAACGASTPPTPIIKEVIKEVPRDVIVTKEVIKEVPKEVTKEVVKEVPAKKTVVRVTGFVSSPAEQNLLKGLMFDFMTKNPDIEVKYEPIADDYGTKIKAQLVSGDAADLFYVDLFEFPFFASKGLLAPLDDQLAKNGLKKEDFSKGLVDAFSSQGKLYGIAKDFNTLALFYNKDLFKKAGIAEPTSAWKWEDLKAAAAKLSDKPNKIYGFGVPPDQGRFLVFVMQAGGTNLMTADFKDTTLDSP
ncbi:MAG: extracellular solute-binding protein, partial [Thermoflexales bacterium]